MKNPWKSCHSFCWVHSVYGMQNDLLDLTVILAEKICKEIHRIRRFLQIFNDFSSLVLQISLDTVYLVSDLRPGPSWKIPKSLGCKGVCMHILRKETRQKKKQENLGKFPNSAWPPHPRIVKKLLNFRILKNKVFFLLIYWCKKSYSF